MTDVLLKLIINFRQSKPSFVPRLSEQDIASVWNNVSDFIEKHLISRKGVAIQGLGVFSFEVQTIDIGNNRSVLAERPIFQLSKQFSRLHSIKYPEHRALGNIPEVSLNYSALAFRSRFDRDTVEMCIKEILNAINHACNLGNTVLVPFQGMGKLTLSEGRGRMHFFSEFVHQQGSTVSVSEGKLANGVSIAITSSPSSSRPGTVCSPATLPKIDGSLNMMGRCDEDGSCIVLRKADTPSKLDPTYEKEEEGKEEQDEEESANTDQCAFCIPTTTLQSEGGAVLPGCEETAGPVEGNQESTAHLCSGCSLNRDGSPFTYLLSEDNMQGSSSSSSSESVVEKLCRICHQRTLRSVPAASADARERKLAALADTKTFDEQLLRKDKRDIENAVYEKFKRQQCNQKVAAINLSMAEAKNAEKNAKDRDLLSSCVFQHRAQTPSNVTKRINYCYQLGQQVQKKAAQHKAAREAEEEMNRVEQNIMTKEMEKDHSENIARKNQQVKKYRDALAEQVNIRRQTSMLATSHLNHHGQHQHLPNMALPSKECSSACKTASDSAVGREIPIARVFSLPRATSITPFANRKSKALNNEENPKMDGCKPTPSLLWQSTMLQDSIFGGKDRTSERQRRRRLAARQVLQEQLEAAEQNQQLSGRMARKCREEEVDMLRRTKQDMSDESQVQLKHRRAAQLALERSWRHSICTKHAQACRERSKAGKPSLLLHQQTDKYQRCRQCQRDLNCKNASNVLTESRYLAGAKQMV